MICEQTEVELETLHREAAACCELVAKFLVHSGLPADQQRKILARFAGLYERLGLDPARMEKMIQ